MTREECIQQLDSLIEHFHNGGSDFNATDVLAIKKILEQNQKYKEVFDKLKKLIEEKQEIQSEEAGFYDVLTSYITIDVDELLEILEEVE